MSGVMHRPHEGGLLAMRVAVPLAALCLAAGCAALNPRSLREPSPQDAWQTALEAAQTRASRGDFDGADSVLASIATRYPGTPQALETAYWRGLYRMDPGNRNASIPTALASIDAYLADPRAREHRTEAMTLRRVAAQIDGLNKLAATAMAQATAANANAANARAAAAEVNKSGGEVVSPASDAEIKHLKDELAKANAELERIKKRLAQPPPRS
jgi:hypothetical protein